MRPAIAATAKVVTTGYCPLDLIPAQGGNCYVLTPGGTCGNVSVILSHFGHPVTPVIAVGSDQRGARLRAKMREHGIDTSEIVTTAGRGTPAVAQEILPSAPGKHRFALKCPSCNRPFPRSTGISLATARAVEDKLCQSQCFFLDRATPASLRLADLAASTGLLVMFEANHIRPSSRNSAAAELSHVVKYSNDVDRETQRWLPRPDARTEVIVQTLGADGAKYRVRRADRSWGDWVRVPCILARFIEDTAGAGDWCSSGILHDLLRTRLRRRFTEKSIRRALSVRPSSRLDECQLPWSSGPLKSGNRRRDSNDGTGIAALRQGTGASDEYESTTPRVATCANSRCLPNMSRLTSVNSV